MQEISLSWWVVDFMYLYRFVNPWVLVGLGWKYSCPPYNAKIDTDMHRLVGPH